MSQNRKKPLNRLKSGFKGGNCVKHVPNVSKSVFIYRKNYSIDLSLNFDVFLGFFHVFFYFCQPLKSPKNPENRRTIMFLGSA